MSTSGAWPEEEITVLERVTTPRGELVLRERRCVASDGTRQSIYEVISSGVFLMDSEEMATERALATEGLAPLAGRVGLRVLVGGLGLGYTLAATLRVEGVEEVVVLELEETLARWVAGPLEHLAGAPLRDPRVRLEIADLVPYLRQTPDSWHALLLDVDNGPEFMVHAGNAWLYSLDGLHRMRELLEPGGVLTVWSSEPSPGLLERMTRVFDRAEELAYPVQRGRHRFDYYLYRGIT